MVDLLLETPLDDEQKEYVNAARLCAENLFELLNATLEYSALQAGQCTLDEHEFGVREMLDATLAQFQPKALDKKLELSALLDSRLPETVIGDAPRIRELLGHLLSNAIKFTPAGGVELRARGESQPGGPDVLVLEVRDSGIGIAPERLHTIFESFQQVETGLSRSFAGLGLGLAVARELANLMGGKIEVASQIGSGSIFTVRIPVRRPAVAVPEPAAEPERAPESGPWVLAVDDNAVGLKVIRHLLQRRKVHVDCVDSAREAYVAVSRRQYDVILMDLQMPDIDGFTAAEALRRMPGCEEVPILALTANFSDEVRQQCRASGMQAFLAKPIEAEELWSVLSRYIPVAAAPKGPQS